MIIKCIEFCFRNKCVVMTVITLEVDKYSIKDPAMYSIYMMYVKID